MENFDPWSIPSIEEMTAYRLNVEEMKTLDGKYFQKITYPDGHIETQPINFPYSYLVSTGGDYGSWIADSTTSTIGSERWSIEDYNELKKHFESKEDKQVDVYRKQSYNSGEHIIACSNEKDLSIENILKTLSAIKGKLMIDVAPMHLREITCSMTPLVRKNIVDASKRLKMYGKKRPIIARFDEYGNRLSDEIDLGTDQGITLKIIDPESYGKYYLELTGIEFSKTV